MDFKQIKKLAKPTIISIFGATGDLAQRKLFPALFDLYAKRLLPKEFAVMGLSRQEMSEKEFRQFAKQAITAKGHDHSDKDVDRFLLHFHYLSGDFGQIKTYKDLNQHIEKYTTSKGLCFDKLFYLAIPPTLYEMVAKKISAAKLTELCDDKHGWTRVLVEKPFGNNYKMAKKLDKVFAKLFKDEQVYRIDHYLAKETLNNILMFRFSNALFEPLWNSKYIDRIEIEVSETLGVGNRAGFYDGVGALRDVGQNHVLQMLALTLMEMPKTFSASEIRKERAKVLSALKPITARTAKTHIVRGQYKGYKKINGVSSKSKTETYFAIKAEVNTKRWQGVPLYLSSGKKLNERKAEVRVFFKKEGKCVCPTKAAHDHHNQLTFKVQPKEGISIKFLSKVPGIGLKLAERELDFHYEEAKEWKNIPDAYERLLFDGIHGEQMLFTSSEEVLSAWKFVEPIHKHFESLPLSTYEPGTEGPKAGLSLLRS